MLETDRGVKEKIRIFDTAGLVSRRESHVDHRNLFSFDISPLLSLATSRPTG